MKNLMLAGLLVMTAFGMVFPTQATLSITNTWVVGTSVPDNNQSGWSDSRWLTTLAGSTIVPGTLEVTLNLSGGWNGDLYAYLVHGSGFAVLLDRVGFAGTGHGYGDTGFDIRLASTGNPIENYQAYPHGFSGGQLLGTWQAHGDMSAFDGLDPNGYWTLFVADVNGGDVSTLQSWGVQMDIVAVPEVETWIAAALAGMFGAFWLNRQIWSEKRR